MLGKLKNFSEKHTTEILVICGVLTSIAISKYNEKRRPYDILKLEVVKGMPKRMQNGHQLKYVGENGDYQFFVQNKSLGTLFED